MDQKNWAFQITEPKYGWNSTNSHNKNLILLNKILKITQKLRKNSLYRKFLLRVITSSKNKPGIYLVSHVDFLSEKSAAVRSSQTTVHIYKLKPYVRNSNDQPNLERSLWNRIRIPPISRPPWRLQLFESTYFTTIQWSFGVTQLVVFKRYKWSATFAMFGVTSKKVKLSLYRAKWKKSQL